MKTNKYPHLPKDIEHIALTAAHVEPLLRAFGPLLIEKERWIAEQPEKKTTTISEHELAQGIAIIQQGLLFSEDDPWKSAGMSVANGIKKGFPQFADDMAKLTQCISTEEMDCFSSGLAEKQSLDLLAEQTGIDLPALQLFSDFVLKFISSLKARELEPLLAGLAWGKGYCPVCAHLPSLALIRERGQRFLQCGQCSHEWLFPRLTCPACGCEDSQDSQLVFIDGNEADKAFVCSNCKRYLITSNRSESLRQIPADLIALSLTHFDIILQDKGFLPMEKA